MQEAWGGSSKHCTDCEDRKICPERDDEPESEYCDCRDSAVCPAVEAVYSEMDRLKDDIDVSETAIGRVIQDITNYADSDNAGALLDIINSALRFERFQTAKTNELI